MLAVTRATILVVLCIILCIFLIGVYVGYLVAIRAVARTESVAEASRMSRLELLWRTWGLATSGFHYITGVFAAKLSSAHNAASWLLWLSTDGAAIIALPALLSPIRSLAWQTSFAVRTGRRLWT